MPPLGPTPTSFKKGHRPWNADLKGIHLSPGSEFKPGRPNERRVPVGTIRIRTRRRDNKPRAFVKIGEPDKWRLRAVIVWERAHGPIPHGKLIHHVDDDTLNDAIENLECITRAEHVARHRAMLAEARREARRQRALP